MNFFRKVGRYIKSKLDVNVSLSIIAIVVSLITMYYQFFNVEHDLQYTFLFPSIGEKIAIPIVYKNDGNQNEMILESNVELEIIPDDGSEQYFKRIGDENKRLFPLILTPGEYKTITLLGDYKEYFKGMLEQLPAGVRYREIVNLDTLSVVITTQFISTDGISKAQRHIGKITFRKDRTFDRISINPIKLTKLEADDEIEMTGGGVINADYNMNFKMTDTLSADQIEHVKFMLNVVEDTLLKNELIKVLKRNNAYTTPQVK